jgi:cell division protein FtsB
MNVAPENNDYASLNTQINRQQDEIKRLTALVAHLETETKDCK